VIYHEDGFLSNIQISKERYRKSCFIPNSLIVLIPKKKLDKIAHFARFIVISRYLGMLIIPIKSSMNNKKEFSIKKITNKLI
jgi:hypothetical protein